MTDQTVTPCVLVCVTVQKDCGRLIEAGKQAALEMELPLKVLHVSKNGNLLGNPDAAEAINYLFSLARQADAEMNILYESDAPRAIARYARQEQARLLILGQDRTGFALQLQHLLPENTRLQTS